MLSMRLSRETAVATGTRALAPNGVTCGAIIILALSMVGRAGAQDVPGCGTLTNSYGPFDYRDPVARSKHLHIVEAFHFTPDVAMLIHGSTGSIIKDLDHTLRAFPNHYIALESVKRYALGGGKMTVRPAECYFKRAIAFRPDDSGARIIYGNYLLQCTKLADGLLRQRLQCAGYADPSYMDSRVLKVAREQYETALMLAPTSPEVNYNAALFFLNLNDLEKAKRLAAVAYGAGYPLMGLKKELQAAEAGNRSPRP